MNGRGWAASVAHAWVLYTSMSLACCSAKRIYAGAQAFAIR